MKIPFNVNIGKDTEEHQAIGAPVEGSKATAYIGLAIMGGCVAVGFALGRHSGMKAGMAAGQKMGYAAGQLEAFRILSAAMR